MRARIFAGALVLLVCLALPMSAQEGEKERPERPERPLPAQVREKMRDMTPEERERMVEEMRRRGEEAREKAEERGVYPRGGFIIGFLQQQPEYREAVQAHNKKMQEIQAQLAEIRREAAQKMRATRTPEARQAVIAEAREETAELFKQLIDEAVRHHEEIAELTRANKDKIIEQALENIYDTPREREDRPMRREQD